MSLFSKPDSKNLSPLSDILNHLVMAFIMNPSNGQSIAGSEQTAKQIWADQTFLANPDLNSFLTTSFAQNEISNPEKPKSFLVWFF